MPELPEVTTTVNGLQKVLPRMVITGVWTDLAKKHPIKQFVGTIKDEKFYQKFKKEIIGAKVLNVERRAKNILINLDNGQTILIHMKMTGNLLFNVPNSKFVHVTFTFQNGKRLDFSDMRKFGKVTMFPTNKIAETLHLKNVGPEPLEKSFTFPKFKERLAKKPTGKIKTVLMDQSVVAGIGNIYSDEILWLAGVHPESIVRKIPLPQLKAMYSSMKILLNKGIDFGGDSMSDYRNIHGDKGHFQAHHNAYQKAKEKCSKRGCGGVIVRKVVGARSAHFCPKHQKIY